MALPPKKNKTKINISIIILIYLILAIKMIIATTHIVPTTNHFFFSSITAS